MIGKIEIDPLLLTALSGDLAAFSNDVPTYVSRAHGLQAGQYLAPLADSGRWAGTASLDLQERVHLLAQADQLGLGRMDTLGFSALDVAGSRGSVVESLMAVDELLELQASGAPLDWGRLPHETLDDYVNRMVERGVAMGLGNGPAGQAAGTALDWYDTYGGMLVAGAGTLASLQQFNLAYRGRPWLNTLSAATVGNRLPSVTAYLSSLAAPGSPMTAPFTSTGVVNGQAVRGLMALRDPGVLTQRLTQLEALLVQSGHPGLAARVPSLAPLVSRAAGAAPLWFGQAWTAADGATIARGSTNLVTVARTSGLGVAARTSGLWRGAGIVGGVAATAYDGYNVYLQGNPVEAFKREGAGYVADIAKTGFNASLTAAMIAPSPVTWGAVAITGTVWAVAEAWDQREEIGAALGEARDRAADWGSDRVDDAKETISDVGKGISDGIDAVKKSKVNPANWF